MPSKQYNNLKENVDTLRRHLLPSEFNNLGDYDDQVFTRVVAFRVLSHAAIEDYFEERVIEIARSAQIASQKNEKITQSAACLVAFSGRRMEFPPATIDPDQPNKKKSWPEQIDFREKINSCACKFIAHVKSDNHGIREKDILSLLLPVGLKHSEIDKLLVSELENFGKSRGEYAHSSVSKHVTNKPNPDDELRKVNNIIDMIERIDESLNALLSNIT